MSSPDVDVFSRLLEKIGETGCECNADPDDPLEAHTCLAGLAEAALVTVGHHLRQSPMATAVVRRRLEAACRELAREVARRRRVYPRFVAGGRLSQAQADRQVETMQDAERLLRLCLMRVSD